MHACQLSPIFAGLQYIEDATLREPIAINEADVPDGTHLVIYRLDGSEAIVSWAVGSLSGHHTIAFRDPDTGELFVHEVNQV